MAIGGDPDPFAQFVRPPPDETPVEKAQRVKAEAEAQRISDQIDEQIKQDKVAWNKQKVLVKVLLLGQSESGKSTTLKNFRMTYVRKEWEAEKVSWRAVIQLNLIRSITTIIDTIQAEMDGEPVRSSSEETTFEEDVKGRSSTDLSREDARTSSQQTPESPSRAVFSASQQQQLQTIKLRLAPLRRIEADLKKKLGAGTEEVTSLDVEDDSSRKGFNPGAVNGTEGRPMLQHRRSRRFKVQGEETYVFGSRWREILSHGLGSRRNSLGNNGVQHGMDEEGSATDVIAGCREAMKALWTDELVRSMLKKRQVRLEYGAGFFLDDIDRIATRSYLPSDDDVVRSRLRTLGVQEYRITFSSVPKNDIGREWIIYDVGGSRTARRAWLPYFEGVNSIIFLAPISCFNETLLEDPLINRLNDSLALWRAINTSKLLETTTMICFLNKCDILKRKLRNGVVFREYVPEFGDKENDVQNVVKFIKERFKDIAIKYSPAKRTTYLYTTSVTDTKATATTLKSVRDSILRENLEKAHLV